MFIATLMRRKVLLSIVLVVSAGLAGGMTSCPPIDPGSDGDGTFARVVVDSAASGGASCVAVADFNGDSQYDVISTWSKTNEVRLHLQAQAAGQVGWTTSTLVSGNMASGARTAAIADISNDGRLDVLVGTDKGHILYLRQTGSNPGALSNWNISLIAIAEGNPDPYTDIQVADIDGDGRQELLVSQAGDSHRVSIFKAPLIALDGSGWSHVDIATAGRAGANQVIPIDMDADGDIDLVSLASGEGADSIVWYANPGPTKALADAWSRHAIGHVPDPRGASLVDIDGDTFFDLVVSSGSGKSISWFRAPTTLDALLDPTARWSQFAIGTLGTDNGGPVAIADIDKDGLWEILVGTTGAGKLSMFQSDLAVWTETVIDSTGGNYGRLIPVDLDNDGTVDIVTGVDAATSAVLWYKQ